MPIPREKDGLDKENHENRKVETISIFQFLLPTFVVLRHVTGKVIFSFESFPTKLAMVF